MVLASIGKWAGFDVRGINLDPLLSMLSNHVALLYIVLYVGFIFFCYLKALIT